MELVLVLGILVLLALGAFAAVSVTKRSHRRMECDLRGRSVIDDEVWDELEEALIRADVGVTVTGKILDDLRVRVKEASVTTPDELLDLLKTDLVEQLSTAERSLTFSPGQPNVWM